MKLHERIKYERKLAGLTLIRLSTLANVSYGMLYRLEDGAISQPNPELLKAVLGPLGVEYRKFLEEYNYIDTDSHQNISFELSCEDREYFSLSSMFNASKSVLGCYTSVQLENIEEFFQCDSDDFLPFFKRGSLVGVTSEEIIRPFQLYFAEFEERPELYVSSKEGENLFVRPAKDAYASPIDIDPSLLRRICFLTTLI